VNTQKPSGSKSTDPSGAAIPGTTATGQGFVFDADINGRSLERAIPAGKYKLTVEAQGFQGEERTGVVIDVNQNVTISLTLAFATTRQSVEAISQADELGTSRDARHSDERRNRC
jgi:hypothetical protein